jgi:hypothetical protein
VGDREVPFGPDVCGAPVTEGSAEHIAFSQFHRNVHSTVTGARPNLAFDADHSHVDLDVLLVPC